MPSRRRRGRQGSARSLDRTGQGAPGREQGRSGGRIRRLLASPIGILLGALAALFTAIVVGVGQELIPKENLADQFRRGDPFTVTVVAEPPHEAVPGAVARERLDSLDSQRVIESMRAPFSEAVGKARFVPASQTQIHLQLTGQRSQPVNVIGMHIRVLKREPPLTGTLLLGPGPQGSSLDVVLQATVDDLSPRLVEFGGQNSAQQPYFATHRISLARAETVSVVLFTTVGHCYCEWDLAIDYLADGKQSVLYAGRDGIVHGDRDPRPFAISALPARIQDYGVVYTLPAQVTTDFHYRRISSDQYCDAVSAFYAQAYPEKALGRWAC
jgi:hypothetical protein